jgi:hypothetical protein
VVAGKVDHTLPLPLPEAPQSGEQALVLGALDRQRRPIPPLRHLAYLQKVKEVSGQDQLDGALASRQLRKESLEFLRRLEAVAPRVPPDVGVRDKDHQGIVAEF